jgi:predicted tellurium resistance membrane protein TerC
LVRPFLNLFPDESKMFENLSALAYDPAAWTALVALIAMEIVLGIDNLIFISIISNKLPPGTRDRARRVGIGLALVLRLALLAMIAFIVQLTEPVATVFGHEFSWRDMILIAGGLFLVWKATKEIHHNVDPDPGPDIFDRKVAEMTFGSAIAQILALDIVFSIDSIITAVGMTDHVPIMMVAVIVAVIVMLVASGPLSRFIHANPTIVMLALGFLLMIGMTLIADGFGVHVPKGYIYAAMAFSTFIESLNLLSRKAKRRAREKGA